MLKKRKAEIEDRIRHLTEKESILCRGLDPAGYTEEINILKGQLKMLDEFSQYIKDQGMLYLDILNYAFDAGYNIKYVIKMLKEHLSTEGLWLREFLAGW